MRSNLCIWVLSGYAAKNRLFNLLSRLFPRYTLRKKTIWRNRMIKEKYTQLCLAHQFGGINTIGYTQPLCAIRAEEQEYE